MPSIPYKTKSGRRIPGVTTVIGNNLGWNKEQLKGWAWRQGQAGLDYRATTQRAADAGSIAHYLIECDLKKITPNLDTFKDVPDLVKEAKFSYEQNFLPWKEMTKFEVLSTEEHLVSEVFEFGATPDMIAKVRGKRSIFDWKTTGGLYPEMVIQVAAYEQAWNEVHPDQLIEDGAYMLRIDRETASFHFHHWYDLSKPWAAFLALLQLHNMHYDIKRMT
jgi:hypothetical protein